MSILDPREPQAGSLQFRSLISQSSSYQERFRRKESVFPSHRGMSAVPSPKFQIQSVMDPSGSYEPVPSNCTFCPTCPPYGPPGAETGGMLSGSPQPGSYSGSQLIGCIGAVLADAVLLCCCCCACCWPPPLAVAVTIRFVAWSYVTEDDPSGNVIVTIWPSA